MRNANQSLAMLLAEVRACDLCAGQLPLGPRPTLTAAPQSKILIIGQAPGTRVHATGIPWNDPSGRRLRGWLGVEAADFYDASKFAIIPMGFCYPAACPGAAIRRPGPNARPPGMRGFWRRCPGSR
jgi:uracil-DNA glycosylase